MTSGERVLLKRLNELLARQDRVERTLQLLELRVGHTARDVDAIDRYLRPHGDGTPTPLRRRRS